MSTNICRSIQTTIGALLLGAGVAEAQAGISVDAKRVFERHTAAVGSPLTPTTEHMIAIRELPANQEMRIETFRDGDKFLSRTTLPGMGTTDIGFDGTTAWQVSDVLGPRLMAPEDIKRPLAEGGVATDSGVKAAVVGQSVINGKPAVAIHVVTGKGATYVQYFDLESGLMTAHGPKFTPFRVEDLAGMVLFADYKRIGGRMRPMTITVVAAPGQLTIMRIVSIDHERIDPAVFEIPASVKALGKP